MVLHFMTYLKCSSSVVFLLLCIISIQEPVQGMPVGNPTVQIRIKDFTTPKDCDPRITGRHSKCDPDFSISYQWVENGVRQYDYQTYGPVQDTNSFIFPAGVGKDIIVDKDTLVWVNIRALDDDVGTADFIGNFAFTFYAPKDPSGQMSSVVTSSSALLQASGSELATMRVQFDAFF